MIRTTLTISVLLLLLIGMIGCGGGPKITEEIYWPPPPQKPKIAYVKTIYGTLDLKRNFWGKIKDFFLGKAEELGIEKPYGVYGSEKKRLYIVDTAKKGILVFDLNTGTARLHQSLGKYGQLLEPIYLVLDDQENIYVADSKIGRIVVFDPEFNFIRFIGGEDDFEAPVGMAFDATYSRLYVVDTRAHMVKMFSKDGTRLGQFGKRGEEAGEFHYPLTITISNDTIFIVDSFHFAVQAFDLDGKFLYSFGPSPAGMGPMARPRDIAIDQNGFIFITDAIRNNVQIYNRRGDLLLRFGSTGDRVGQFQLPAGIHIDEDNYIYIADSMNRRIQVFKSYITEDDKEHL